MAADTAKPVIEASNVTRTFREGVDAVKVLQGIDLRIGPGEQIAIIGASGTGKSTLLHLLGGLDDVTSGKVEIAGQDIATLSPAQRGRLRNRELGFVYQFHHLLPEFSAAENVAMPLLIRGDAKRDAIDKASTLLGKVGLDHRLRHKPGELSGGERQRAAVARALITEPSCVLADEPTGNLDERTADGVHELMLALNSEHNTSLVVVTHDLQLAAKMSRQLRLHDGRLEGVSPLAQLHLAPRPPA